MVSSLPSPVHAERGTTPGSPKATMSQDVVTRAGTFTLSRVLQTKSFLQILQHDTSTSVEWICGYSKLAHAETVFPVAPRAASPAHSAGRADNFFAMAWRRPPPCATARRATPGTGARPPSQDQTPWPPLGASIA